MIYRSPSHAIRGGENRILRTYRKKENRILRMYRNHMCSVCSPLWTIKFAGTGLRIEI